MKRVLIEQEWHNKNVIKCRKELQFRRQKLKGLNQDTCMRILYGTAEREHEIVL